MNEEDELNSLRKNYYSFISRFYLDGLSSEMAKDLADNHFPIPSPENNPWMNQTIKNGFLKLKEYMQNNDDQEKIKDSLAKEFTSLFHGPLEKEVLPYESKYIDGEIRSDSLIEVKKFLIEIEFGKTDNFPEPEDHISFEFEIMRHLIEENDQKNQKEFFENHINKWVKELCQDLKQKAKSKYFEAAAEITEGFIDFENEIIEDMD